MSDRRLDALTLILGTVVVLATMAAYLYAQVRGIEVDALLAFVVPVVSALLIVRQVDKVHATTKQVEKQTNGELTRRLEDHRAATVAEVRQIVEGTVAPALDKVDQV